ncbi:MAG: N-6 DNA methylase, partial [Clostridia bacterium]|nr:N-6 DNA methylase [Clostridia bacterium]
MFPDEAAQIQAIDEAVSVPQTPAASFSHADIEAELCRGTGIVGGKMRVSAMYQRRESSKAIQDFLKKEYGTMGHSLTFLDGTSGFVDYRPGQGMKLVNYRTKDETVLKWPAVEKHLRSLVTSDRYLTAEEKQVFVERQRAAELSMAGNVADLDKPDYAEPPIMTDDLSYSSDYELDFKYVNDRLIVFNIRNHDPGQLSPIVARVEPDGEIVIIDEHLPEKERLEIQRAAESDLDIYKAQAEASLRQMVDAVEAPPSFAQSDAPRYSIGDTLYLEDGKPFIVEDIGFSEVRLRDPALLYPILRSESMESLRRLLERYPQPDLDEQTQEPEAESAEPETEKPAETESSMPPVPLVSPENFRITDDHLGEGGAKTKYAANVAAIRLLQTIEGEGRMAAPEEQEILSRYVGWGGIPQAFDDQNASWSREYTELKSLLPDLEYASARASTLNAHYTSPVVIKAIYQTIERMGFTTGNILEPACGVGNFFGLLPESMAGSNLYGVELDSITGRIASQLYPKATITVSGFEKTDQRDFYDLAVGNVPFGSYQVSDKAYDKLGFYIHDYFFAKAIDQVRPGGVVAFITSKGTMDKQSPEVRRYIAERAELLGAVRLPNNAFKANAGTEVTTDILFLKKHDRPIVIEPDWVHLNTTEDGIPVNSYFTEHPEMILGQMAWDDSMYGNHKETACLPIEGEELSVQLSRAMANITGQIIEAELPDLGESEVIDDSLPADPNVKNFSYTLVNGEVYYRENSRMVRPELNATARERVRGLVELRDCVRELIDLQMVDTSDSLILETQYRLNGLYDDFTGKYGLLSSRGNAIAFADDSSYYLLCSLEILDENGALASKADMFTKRTIRPAQAVEHVDTASEALALAISEKARVDMDYMERLTGKSTEELAADLRGVVFLLPGVDEGESQQYAP